MHDDFAGGSRTCYVATPMISVAMRRCILLVALLACGLAARVEAQTGPASCTTAGQNLYVRDVMNEIYFWYQEMPTLNPVRFASPEAYLEAVRYRPLDESFSYITSRAANDAFYSDSQFIGFGLSTSFSPGRELRVSSVFPESPASEAGLSRGDRIVEINGRTIDALIEADAFADAFGPPEIGVDMNLLVDRGGTPFRALMIKRLVTIPTVSLTQVHQVNGRNVGYVFFRNFVEPSYAALDAAFDDLHARNVRELVLDLRYNGGGLVSVAQHLASLIGGVRTEGLVFAEYFHNDKNASLNRMLRFEPKPNALTLDRLVVITTRGSASASELVINALKPFMPVLVIGDRTYGKPVGQYGIPVCDKVLAPVSFTLRNADGEGDFFDGFAPTCEAPDDLARQLGDPLEGSLREALGVLASGRCSRVPTQALQPSKRSVMDERSLGGWQALVGAH